MIPDSQATANGGTFSEGLARLSNSVLEQPFVGNLNNKH